MIKRLLLPLWILIACLLTLYSFTQVSLSLTLTRASIWQGIQQAFQYVGYFNRSLSTMFFLLIVLMLFALFIATLFYIQRNVISKKVFSMLILVVSVVLFVSYTAFSFDIFNYIFDAKVVTHYHENPYERKALDYPEDPMLSFMHWTHRTYPYGPVWLATTIPLSYIGFQYFLPTYYIFKLLAVASYLATAWLIYKIMLIKAKKYALFAAAFFALNPLILVEFLVSGHNDIYMIFLAALSLYLLVNKKRVLSLFTFLISVGVKFATGFFAPMWLFLLLKPKQWEFALKLGVVLGIVAVFVASWKSGNFQPWYFSYVLFVASFISYKKYILFPAILFSFFCLLQYSPFLYYGHWDPPVPQLLRTILYTGIAASLISMIYGYKKYPDKRL